MGKSNKKQNSKQTNTPKITQTQPQVTVSHTATGLPKIISFLFGSAWRLICTLSTIGGIWYLISILIPDVKLSLLDPYNPNSLKIQIKNNSYFSIESISTVYLIDKIAYRTGAVIVEREVSSKNDEVQVLKSGQSLPTDFDLPIFFKGYAEGLMVAELAMKVNYTYLWIEHSEYIFVKNQVSILNQYLWVEQPEQNYAKKIEESKNKNGYWYIPNQEGNTIEHNKYKVP